MEDAKSVKGKGGNRTRSSGQSVSQDDSKKNSNVTQKKKTKLERTRKRRESVCVLNQCVSRE